MSCSRRSGTGRLRAEPTALLRKMRSCLCTDHDLLPDGRPIRYRGLRKFHAHARSSRAGAGDAGNRKRPRASSSAWAARPAIRPRSPRERQSPRVHLAVRARHCPRSKSIFSPTCWCTIWVRVLPTASPKDRLVPMNLGRRRYGAWGSVSSFLHDGRTNDLLAAIRAHTSRGSEANTVIQRFNGLNPVQQQYILDFVRSL